MRIFGLSLSLILLVILGVRWISLEPPSASSRSPDGPVTAYYLRQASITTLGATGQPERVLQTAEIRQLAGDAGTQLSQPILTLYPSDGPSWRMVADSGWLDVSGDHLQLSGAVQLSRAATARTAPIRMQTEALQIQLPRRYVETALPVQISSGWQRLQAVGMQAWLQAPVRLELLHQVEGRYVPAHE